jgi:hypothetical protein
MLVSTNELPLGAAEPDSVFSVVAAYEDIESGRHAQRTCDFLTEQLGQECRFLNQMWKFDALAVPGLCEMAANDAALADLIVVACHGSQDLPVDVKAWIELWIGLRGPAFGLVALFDRRDDQGGQTRIIEDYLVSVAHRAGMEFFAHPDCQPEKHVGRAQSARVNTRDVREILPFPVAAVPTKYVNVGHWGLNE